MHFGFDRANAADLKPPPKPRQPPRLRSIQGGKSIRPGLSSPRFHAASFWLVGALVLAICAVLVDDVSPLLANLLALAAVVAVLMPIIQHFRRPATPSQSKMWRGQVLEVTPPQSSPLDQLRHWWQSRSSH